MAKKDSTELVVALVNTHFQLIHNALWQLMQAIHLNDDPCQGLYWRAEKLHEITECGPFYCSSPTAQPAPGDVETIISALSMYSVMHDDDRADCVAIIRALIEPMIDNRVDG